MLRPFYIRTAFISPLRHTEIMKVLHNCMIHGYKDVNRRDKRLETYTSPKKFSVCVNPHRRNTFPYAIGNVVEEEFGSTVHLKIWMNPIQIFIILLLNIGCFCMVVSDLVLSFKWSEVEVLKMFGFTVPFSMLLWLVFHTQAKQLKRTILNLLKGSEIR